MTTIQLRRGTAQEWTQANPTLAEGEPGFEIDSGRHKIGNGTLAWEDLDYFLPEGDLGAQFIPRSVNELAQTTPVPVFELVPRAPGWAPFQIRMRSFPNQGGGAGTHNRALFMGWNAGRHAQDGSATSGSPAVYMGFEDNYFDPDADLSFGVEWYVGYISPDGTSVDVGNLRPFYFRVLESQKNETAKSVHLKLDIGSGDKGGLMVLAGAVVDQRLLEITKKVTVFRTPQVAFHSALLTQEARTGPATHIINGQSTSAVAFRLGSRRAFDLTVSNPEQFVMWDKAGNAVTVWNYGPDRDSRVLDLRATLRLGNSSSQSARSGTAAALPAQPSGYFTIQDAQGRPRKVPFYDA